MKKVLQVSYIISPGILYIILFLIDFISKGNLVKIPILNFFEGINNKLPFGYLLNSFFIPCLIFSFLICIGWLLICKIKNFEKNKYFISLFSLLSFCASVIFSLLFIFIIGMYAILVKGEFM